MFDFIEDCIYDCMEITGTAFIFLLAIPEWWPFTILIAICSMVLKIASKVFR